MVEVGSGQGRGDAGGFGENCGVRNFSRERSGMWRVKSIPEGAPPGALTSPPGGSDVHWNLRTTELRGKVWIFFFF